MQKRKVAVSTYRVSVFTEKTDTLRRSLAICISKSRREAKKKAWRINFEWSYADGR